MFRFVIAMAVLTASTVSELHAQYPPPPGYGYGYGGGGTVASNNMNGMANLTSAKGSYNLQTSQAAINMTQAQSQEIANHQQYTDTYFQMRATNQAATEAERGPHPTTQQLAQIAADGVPKPISPGEMDPVSGALAWPDLLQDDPFKDQRTDVEKLVAKQASQGRLGFTDQKAARETLDDMFHQLKAEIADVPSQQYAASRSFLQSLIYQLTKTELD